MKSDKENKHVEKQKLFERLFIEFKAIVAAANTRDDTLASLCRLLKERVPYYDWVGFYLVEADNQLVLGPFEGEPTEHIRIEFGRGICGQAAERQKTIAVQDVSTQSNYLSCSAAVKAEIVVPVFKHGTLVAELDIDSHRLGPFTAEDREFLQRLCENLSVLF
jgi:GAF domain-containing protein